MSADSYGYQPEPDPSFSWIVAIAAGLIALAFLVPTIQSMVK